MEEEKKSDISKIFGDIFFGKNDQIIEKLVEDYNKALVSALSIGNTPLVMFLYYRFFFNKNKKHTIIVFEKVINEVHHLISNELMKSIDDARDIPFFREKTDELVEQFKEAMGHARDKVREGIVSSFEDTLKVLSEYEKASNNQTAGYTGTASNTKATPSGKENDGKGGEPSETSAGEDNNQ